MSIPQNAIKGDFNGDKVPEYAWLIAPELTKDGQNCIGGKCEARIVFSNKRIKPITISNCIGGSPVNLGDLNNNKTDEIGLLPDWFTSCWRAYYVFSYKSGLWQYLVPPISTHCNQWENNIVPIEKDSVKKGYVIIRYSDFDHGEIVTKTKSVALK